MVTATGPMPTWLLDHLIRSGHLTETGIGRRAHLRRCPRRTTGRRCGAVILTGLDAEICALEVQADPTPLSPLGEALALVEGRRTLHLHRERGSWVLDHRSHLDIADAPAGAGRRQDVVREHRCGTDLPATFTAPSTFPETQPSPPPDAAPPF